MGLGRTVTEVAAELRRRIIRGEFGNGGLPGERKLRTELGCSRYTLHTALVALQVEGLVYSIPTGGWHQRDLREDASFDMFDTIVRFSSPAEWQALVAQLLEYRASQVIGGVDALVLSGGKTPFGAKVWHADIRYVSDRMEWSAACASEDRVFAELLSSETNLPQTMAAHQVRRALARVRALLLTDVRVSSQAHRLGALFDAIDAGDRHAAVALAAETATSRDSIYLELMRKAVDAPWVKKPGKNTDFAPAENGLT